MLNAICFIVGIIGALLLAYGAWLLLPALGFITGGILCLVWSFLMAKAMSIPKPTGD